jgi:hypothetical protein
MHRTTLTRHPLRAPPLGVDADRERTDQHGLLDALGDPAKTSSVPLEDTHGHLCDVASAALLPFCRSAVASSPGERLCVQKPLYHEYPKAATFSPGSCKACGQVTVLVGTTHLTMLIVDAQHSMYSRTTSWSACRSSQSSLSCFCSQGIRVRKDGQRLPQRGTRRPKRHSRFLLRAIPQESLHRPHPPDQKCGQDPGQHCQ